MEKSEIPEKDELVTATFTMPKKIYELMDSISCNMNFEDLTMVYGEREENQQSNLLISMVLQRAADTYSLGHIEKSLGINISDYGLEVINTDNKVTKQFNYISPDPLPFKMP